MIHAAARSIRTGCSRVRRFIPASAVSRSAYTAVTGAVRAVRSDRCGSTGGSMIRLGSAVRRHRCLTLHRRLDPVVRPRTIGLRKNASQAKPDKSRDQNSRCDPRNDTYPFSGGFLLIRLLLCFSVSRRSIFLARISDKVSGPIERGCRILSIRCPCSRKLI